MFKCPRGNRYINVYIYLNLYSQVYFQYIYIYSYYFILFLFLFLLDTIPMTNVWNKIICKRLFHQKKRNIYILIFVEIFIKLNFKLPNHIYKLNLKNVCISLCQAMLTPSPNGGTWGAHRLVIIIHKRNQPNLATEGKKKQLIENNFRILQYFGNWCVTLFSKIWRFQSTFQYFFNFSIINNFHFFIFFSIFVIQFSHSFTIHMTILEAMFSFCGEFSHFCNFFLLKQFFFPHQILKKKKKTIASFVPTFCTWEIPEI